MSKRKKVHVVNNDSKTVIVLSLLKDSLARVVKRPITEKMISEKETKLINENLGLLKEVEDKLRGLLI
jgi:hypothetical protein